MLESFRFMERLNIVPGFFDLTPVYTPAQHSVFWPTKAAGKVLFSGAGCRHQPIPCPRHLARRLFGRWGKIGAAMIIGGAIGNVIDRLFYGHVVDFYCFYWQDWFYPAFNIADSFICVGVVSCW